MKNLLNACLPALALFALGGCAGTSALTSAEDDGVYYSSKDRTTAVARTAPAPAPATNSEEANPDYNGGSTKAAPARPNSSSSDQYYDNTYTYMRGARGYGSSSSYYGPGLSYYSPYSPYTSLSYGGYAYGGGACGYSPYGYGGYDPFYSSLYSPYAYGYGSGLSISFGFGRSFGYGGYGYSAFGYGYSPYGYGYSPYGYGGGYDPYYYNSPYYGGYYGRGGYYGSAYNGSVYNGGGFNNNGANSGPGPVRTYGHRNDRSSDGQYSAGTSGSVPGTGNPATPNSGGRSRTTERVMPNNPEPIPMSTAESVGRTRSETFSAAPVTEPTRANDGYNQPRPLEERPRYRNMEPQPKDRPASDAGTDQGQMMGENGRDRVHTTEAQPQNNDQPQPQEGSRRRGGFFQNTSGEPVNNGGGQAAEQPRQRSYEQPQQPTYEQPRQRTYEQPQQRTYEQPQQRSYSQPSYSAPSAPSGGDGGGSGGGHRSRD